MNTDTNSQVLAIVTSDWHLSHRPPLWRSVEPDWYGAMHRTLAQVEKLMYTYRVPIIVAGDVFHHWNNPPELVNWFMQRLGILYAIPGQHDMPHHNLAAINRSSYETLVWSGDIENLYWDRTGEQPIGVQLSKRSPYDRLFFYGYAYGQPIMPLSVDHSRRKGDLHIAVAHQYTWIQGKGHPQSDTKDLISCTSKTNMTTYDAVILGDNHIGFSTYVSKTPVFNCGGLMRRNKDQKDYKPRVGLLCLNLDSNKLFFQSEYLDTSQDKHLKDDDSDEHHERIHLTEKMAAELASLHNDGSDIRSILDEYYATHMISEQTRDLILNLLDCEASCKA